MCGISGLLDFSNKYDINRELLVEMSNYLKYRGPDNEGYYLKKNSLFRLGFAHRRLSVLDLSSFGNQPMISTNKNTVITYNGEIYNFKIVRNQLQQEGVNFKTNSDTEVLIAAYENWGIEKCLNQIEGMFAFAIYDFVKNKIIIARDRFGEKPLYFYKKNQFFGFSSDIRSFNHLPIKKTINRYALSYYFSEMCTPIKESIWNEIQKLPPAHYISFSKEKFEMKKYWEINYKSKINISLNDAVSHTENLIEEAVKKRLISDVPVGCFLSGGLDSSLISLYAAKNSPKKIQTFSVGFNYEKYNELPFAKIVANKINSNHHEIVVDAIDLNSVNNLLKEYGEPFADSSQIPTYLISKIAAEKTKVILGGDGGDELFGGYRTYNQGFRMQKWYDFRVLKKIFYLSHKVSNINKFEYLYKVMKKEATILGSALNRNLGFSKGEISHLMPRDCIPNALELEHESLITDSFRVSNNIFDSILNASLKSRLVNDYLVKTDRASMFNSLELRAPFLDRNLIEFTSSLDKNFIIHNNINKYLIKKIGEKTFTKSFINRKKQGFDYPIGEFFKTDWKDELKEVLNFKNPIVDLNYEYINQLFNDHINNRFDNKNKLWILYVFNKWAMNNR